MKTNKMYFIGFHLFTDFKISFKTHFVGVAGFEPATSCSQSRRDDRATLHPEEVCKYSIINTEIAPYYFEIQKLHSKNLY